MPLKKLGRPQYLIASEIENDDVLEIIEKPWVVPAEKTKWGRDRGKTVVKVLRNGLVRTWSLNNTTWDKLVEEFGDDPGLWLNKKVVVKKELRTISGVEKELLFGKPYHEPQQQLPSEPSAAAPKPQPQPQSQDSEFVEGFKSWLSSLHLDYDTLTEDQKRALFIEYSNN